VPTVARVAQKCQPQPTLNHTLLRKLERHCKQNRQPSDNDDAEILRIIRQLLAETGESSKFRSDTSTENQDGREQWFMVDANRDDGTLLQQSFFQFETSLEDIMTVNSDTSFLTQQDSNDAAIVEATVALPFRSTPLVPQPSQFSDKYKNMQTLFDLTRDYYNYRLQGYSFHFKGYCGRIRESTLEEDDTLDTLAQTKRFWTKIKNTFYFLKIDSQDL
jgi:hypothetical protein